MYTDKIMVQILSKENLNQAYKKVKSNKGPGASVDEIEPPYTERYVGWCERFGNQLINNYHPPTRFWH